MKAVFDDEEFLTVAAHAATVGVSVPRFVAEAALAVAAGGARPRLAERSAAAETLDRVLYLADRIINNLRQIDQVSRGAGAPTDRAVREAEQRVGALVDAVQTAMRQARPASVAVTAAERSSRYTELLDALRATGVVSAELNRQARAANATGRVSAAAGAAAAAVSRLAGRLEAAATAVAQVAS